MDIKVPKGAKEIIDCLQEAGYPAYIVGGCVRDSLLGRTAHDYDITTSANPEEMKQVFQKYPVYETGIKHGTLTISSCGEYYEVTTFRSDGQYSDNRHPDTVRFVKDIREDIRRRDFTMNALAYNDKDGLVDLVSGMRDIKNRVIRCVGVPDERFKEDALRILRALRFSAVFGFSIEPKTERAIHRNKELLANIAKERIHDELVKMLMGRNILDILMKYHDVFSFIIPPLGKCVGFEQNNPYHSYTVYGHTAHAVAEYKGKDAAVAVALLLHDIGKPSCYTADERGGHFYGHAEASAEMAGKILKNLKFDRATSDTAVMLIQNHDREFPASRKSVRKALNQFGYDDLMLLMDVRLADMNAHSAYKQKERMLLHQGRMEMIDELMRENACFSMKDLAINGNDLMSEFNLKTGRKIGEILRALLNAVIADELPNDRSALLAAAKEYI